MSPEETALTETDESSANGSGAGDQPAAKRRRLGSPNRVVSLALITDSTREKYQECYKDIFKNGALDRRTKELIAIGAAAITGCDGCLTGHIRKAKALGVSLEEIREAVGVAFSVNAATVVDHTDLVAAKMGLNVRDDEDEEPSAD